MPGGPLIITHGGTYSGSYQSTDASVPVVSIQTSEPVVLENCMLRGSGHLIAAAWVWANLTVRNCTGYGTNPNDSARTPGRFLQAEGVSSLLVEHNALNGTSGIYVNGWSGNDTGGTTVTIRQNTATNIEGRYSDGHGGFQDKSVAVQFVQLNNMKNLPRAEIAWNRVENTPGQSRVEDVISVHDSAGTPASPIMVHDNLIRGAYGSPPSASYSGGGIMLGDGCTGGYSQAVNNTVLETSNYGVAISGGSHESITGNTILGTGVLTDGTLLDADPDAGLYLRDYCQEAGHDASSVMAQNNTVGWNHALPGSPDNRWDWSVDPASGVASNNTHVTVANKAIDPQLITQAINAWEQRASAAGISAGPH